MKTIAGVLAAIAAVLGMNVVVERGRRPEPGPGDATVAVKPQPPVPVLLRPTVQPPREVADMGQHLRAFERP